MDRPLIIANWKMNTTLSEATVLFEGVKEGLAGLSGVDAVLCPPFLWLTSLAEQHHRHRVPHLYLGAQNLFWQEEGAYTGEISAKMLKNLVHYVIIGHSERRHYFHESDSEITKKIQLALRYGLKPVLCVGEVKPPSAALLADPTDLGASQIRKPLDELAAVLDKLKPAEREQLVVAYEPVWAISGGKANTKAATGHYANRVAELLIDEAGLALPILYGGSVNATNAAEFLHQPQLSGLLVGGASLKINEFVKICRLTVG